MDQTPTEPAVPLDITPDFSQYEIKLYPIEKEFLACLDTRKGQESSEQVDSKIETVVVLDRSGSMGESVEMIVNNVLPKFFELLSYDPETIINLIAFETSTKVHKIKVGDFIKFRMFCEGCTAMAPAVEELYKLFEQFQSNVKSLRIVTISDGEVNDKKATKDLGDKLAEYAGKCNISVNSQAVRFFTSNAQPDTTALCSLLQLNNIGNSQMIDIKEEKKSPEDIAKEMANLFVNDGLDKSKMLKSSEALFYKFPWDKDPTDQIVILPGIKNFFWVNGVPDDSQVLTIDGKSIKVSAEPSINFDVLMDSVKLNFIIDRMKILKIINTDAAKETIDKMVAYFTKIENILIKLAAEEDVDPTSIAGRAKLLKINKILSKQITGFLQTIATDDEVNKLNAEQKAHYLRTVEVSSKAGRGLAKRAAKQRRKNRNKMLSFDEIIHKEVLSIKANFHEIKDIDYKDHTVSFYSQATTFEGIMSLVEAADDVLFKNYTADEILQIINIVGVACCSPKGDYPDASKWRVNEIYYGCYISVADIITSYHQSKDTGFVLKAPGSDKKNIKEITSTIPVFDDPRIGVFLKKYAPSILEFTSSIGMRKVIADVSMTFGYNIIAGIRRMMYDLNKNRSTVHLETFKNLISTASSFVGKYYDHIQEHLKDKDCGQYGYYLDNNGIGNLIVPLIRIYSKKNHEAVKRMPDILRAIYSYEVWKGISKQFRSEKKFNKIVREMIHKLLNIDLELDNVKVAPLFEPEPKREDIKFPDAFEIDVEYLDELTQPLYYHNYMSLLPQLLTAVTSGQLQDIKNIPEMTKTSTMHAFGTDYSYKKFIFLNVYQALRYPRPADRIDFTAQTMKILDTKYHDEVIEDVKKYVRGQFEAQYDFDVKMKQRQEELEMAQTIVGSLMNETSYEAMVNIWKNGITRNNITYKIANSSSNGFKLLCKKLIDLKVEIQLRSKIIEVLLLGVDADGQVVYNNGQLVDIKNIKKYKRRFLLTGTTEDWDKIEEKFNDRATYTYRDKENKRGHGNKKMSYWALGFDSPSEFLKTLAIDERDEYFDKHMRCCDSFNIRRKQEGN
ncbi:unnamed protein product [Chironomus riparius]|uniref:VWFA domain-containing protein n=1 Tax=Chironomus riparius TaxID=315576 RepID=A0A9N9S662_9DIPT|nr:unnamed protein product [Chironomus riparius]